MSALTEKANQLRGALPKTGQGTPPQDTGIRLATFPRPEGEFRLSWSEYEGRPYLRFQLWSKSDDGSFWPVKGSGFTIKVKELPDLAEGVQKALDLALRETRGDSSGAKSREGVEAPF